MTVTNFVRAGIPDRVIQEYIGWDNMEMIRHYSDLAKEEAFAMYFNADGSYGGVDGAELHELKGWIEFAAMQAGVKLYA